MKLSRSKPKNESEQLATRAQILDAAGEVFAEAGFRHATVREICRRAQANIAAINYHFGDKERLYAEVIRYAQQKAMEKHPPFQEAAPGTPPEEKLRAFIHALLLRIFEKGRCAWHGKLLLWEMVEPTPVLEALIQERFLPMASQLQAIIAEILRRPVTDEAVRLSSFSIVSQCVFYHYCRPVLTRLYPKDSPLDAAGAAHLADHIARFSLAALKHMRLPATPSHQP